MASVAPKPNKAYGIILRSFLCNKKVHDVCHGLLVVIDFFVVFGMIAYSCHKKL